MTDLLHHEVVDLFRIDHHSFGDGSLVRLRDPDHDPIVRVDALDLETEAMAHAGAKVAITYLDERSRRDVDAFLAAACKDDSALRAGVQELLG